MSHRISASVAALTCLGLLTAARLAAVNVVSVSTPGELQTALSTAPDGSVIELDAGTYVAPFGGFAIGNAARELTVRAKSGAAVTLSGNGVGTVLRYQASSPALAGHLTFVDLTFSNGLHDDSGAIAGGVTLNGGAAATFIRCTFSNNHNDTRSGGGAWVWGGSTANFVDCLFENNSGDHDGAGLAIADSSAYIDGCTFKNNRNNLPGHDPFASGGGVHLFNSTVSITSSRFEGNEAAYAGGGLFGIGTWDDPLGTDVVVANSTFTGNRAASATPPSPTEGGAIHLENKTVLGLYHSRLVTNDADLGGGLSLFRATATVEDSALLGNRAVGVTGFGGAIKATSDDGAIDGLNNRPASSLTVRDTLIWGRYGGVTTVALNGGGISIAGDGTRQFGTSEVTQIDDLAANRAVALIERVVFFDLDVSGTQAGGLFASIADVTVTDSLFAGCEATASGGSGGALMALIRSDLTVSGTTFAKNRAHSYGGALYVEGSHVDISSSRFFRNELTAGTVTGAALFARPGQGQYLFDVTGTVSGSDFSENVGLAIYDGDNAGGPINDVRYNGNEFFEGFTGGKVYRNELGSPVESNPAELNSLIIDRNPATDTDKSQADNATLGSAPALVALLAVPSRILAAGAVGDVGPTDSWTGFAWTGGSASLDGVGGVAGNIGLETASAGTHTLAVGAVEVSDTVASGPTPTSSFAAVPLQISGGGSSSLEWARLSGTFLDSDIDQHQTTGGAASGSVLVSPGKTRSYRFFLVTKQGGEVRETTVYVDEPPPAGIFSDGFESGDLSAWSAAAP